MRNSIKHGSLYHCIMNHIFKDNFISHLQWLVERPISYKITTQTATSTHSVSRLAFHWLLVCTSNTWLVGHLQTVGHVTCKRHIEHGSLHIVIHNNIIYSGYQHPCLPCKSTTWLHNNIEVWIALFQRF